jgi:SpoVK/Ycf46/Vps4 family AAA+-type ATPase
MEIGLPNEQGRFQILNIHTIRMKDYKKINPDVDIKVRQNGFMLLVGKFQNCFMWILMTQVQRMLSLDTLIKDC